MNISSSRSNPAISSISKEKKKAMLAQFVKSKGSKLPELLNNTALTQKGRNAILTTIQDQDASIFGSGKTLFRTPLAESLYALTPTNPQEKELLQHNLTTLISNDPEQFQSFYTDLPEGPLDKGLSKHSIDDMGLNPKNINDSKKEIIKQLRDKPLSQTHTGPGLDPAIQNVIDQMKQYGAAPVLLGIVKAESKEGGTLLPIDTAKTILFEISKKATANNQTISEFLLIETGKPPQSLLSLSTVLDQIPGTTINTEKEKQFLFSLDSLASDLKSHPGGLSHTWTEQDLNNAHLLTGTSPVATRTLYQAATLSKLLTPTISDAEFKDCLVELLQSPQHRETAQKIAYSACITTKLLEQIDSKTGYKLQSLTELDSTQFNSFIAGGSKINTLTFNSQFDVARSNALAKASAKADFQTKLNAAFSTFDNEPTTPALELLLSTLSTLQNV